MHDDKRGELPVIQLIHVSPLFSSISERPGSITTSDDPAAALANVVRLIPGLTPLPVGPATDEFDRAA